MAYSQKRRSASKKRKKDNEVAPVTLTDLRVKTAPFEKYDTNIRTISIRLVPADADSTSIRRSIEVLDNPSNILRVLQHRTSMEEGLLGNNVTTGPNQYTFVRQFLSGESLRVFNEAATTNGNETVPNMIVTLNALVRFNCPNEVLSAQTDYIKDKLRKPDKMTMRQFVGYFNNLNAVCAQLPPLFDDSQKISARESIIILAKRAPKAHKAMLVQHGFNPENGSMEDFIDYCERAETNAHITHGAKDSGGASSDSSGSESPGSKRVAHKKLQKKKTFKKNEQRPRNKQQQEYFCKYHKVNPTHDSADCKVLNGLKADRDKAAGRNNERGPNRDNKYKKKYKELHLLQTNADKEKAKYKKAYQKLKRVSVQPTQTGSDSPSDSSDDDPNDEDTPYASNRQNNASQRKKVALDISDTSESQDDDDSESDSE
jgi:hypothetical protein